MSDTFARFSLLYADPDATPEIVYDKQITEFACPFPGDEGRELCDVIRRRASRKDLLFRREILEDLMEQPNLLSHLENACDLHAELFETARREIEPSADATVVEAMAAVRENALSLAEHLRFLQKVAREMKGQTPSSGGLFRFCEFVSRHAESEQVKELLERLLPLPMLRDEQIRIVLRFSLDRYGRRTCADVVYLGSDDVKYRKKHPVRRDELTVNIPKDHADAWTAQALVRLAKRFLLLSAGIREAYAPLRRGLVFYRYALSLTEWARTQNYPWIFPSPTQALPCGSGVRDPWEFTDGRRRSSVTLELVALQAYEGTWGTEMLRMLARIQLFAAAGLPVLADDLEFCPETRVTLFDPADRTVQAEIEALAQLYRDTRAGDLILMNHPLLSVGTAPGEDILSNMLRSFRRKGAAVRIATDLKIS